MPNALPISSDTASRLKGFLLLDAKTLGVTNTGTITDKIAGLENYNHQGSTRAQLLPGAHYVITNTVNLPVQDYILDGNRAFIWASTSSAAWTAAGATNTPMVQTVCPGSGTIAATFPQSQTDERARNVLRGFTLHGEGIAGAGVYSAYAQMTKWQDLDVWGTTAMGYNFEAADHSIVDNCTINGGSNWADPSTTSLHKYIQPLWGIRLADSQSIVVIGGSYQRSRYANALICDMPNRFEGTNPIPASQALSVNVQFLGSVLQYGGQAPIDASLPSMDGHPTLGYNVICTSHSQQVLLQGCDLEGGSAAGAAGTNSGVVGVAGNLSKAVWTDCNGLTIRDCDPSSLGLIVGGTNARSFLLENSAFQCLSWNNPDISFGGPVVRIPRDRSMTYAGAASNNISIYHDPVRYPLETRIVGGIEVCRFTNGGTVGGSVSFRGDANGHGYISNSGSPAWSGVDAMNMQNAGLLIWQSPGGMYFRPGDNQFHFDSSPGGVTFAAPGGITITGPLGVGTNTITAGSFVGSGTALTGITVSYPTRWHNLHKFSTVESGGAIGWTQDGVSQEFGGYWRQTFPGAVGDKFSQSIFIAAGTYSLHIGGYQSSNCGIVTWSVDGVDVGTTDFYGSANNAYLTISGIVIATGGNHKLEGRTTGKNASSSNYQIPIDYIEMRTAAD